MHAIMVPAAAVLLALWPAGIRAECVQTGGPLANGNLTETFESSDGTDNHYLPIVESGSFLEPNYRFPFGAPPLWGKKSGRITVGSTHADAFWVKRGRAESPTGYHFTASFMIAVDGLKDGSTISLFISKPKDWQGTWAAWRLNFLKYQGQLQLALFLGVNTATNNASGIMYSYPINANQVYDVAITYDTKRRFYLWSVNGQVVVAANMPCDYPRIAARIIGSSGSSTGRESVFIVDNVRWYELPE